MHKLLVFLVFFAVVILPGAAILLFVRWLTRRYLGEQYELSVSLVLCILFVFILRYLDLFFTN